MKDEGPLVWIYLCIVVVGLAGNLVWPRNRKLKWLLLSLFILVAWHYGSTLGQANAPIRALNAAQNLVARGDNLDAALTWLEKAREGFEEVIFDLRLALTMGIFFALTPADIVTRIISSFRRQPPNDQPES